MEGQDTRADAGPATMDTAAAEMTLPYVGCDQLITHAISVGYIDFSVTRLQQYSGNLEVLQMWACAGSFPNSRQHILQPSSAQW